MLDDYTCIVTGHSPALSFDLRDGHLSQLAQPTVQDLLEYAAERHRLDCPCQLKIGGRAWCTSMHSSDAADCEWAMVESEPLALDTSLAALPAATSQSTMQLVIAGEQSSSTDYLRMYREKLFTPCCVEDAVAYKRFGVPHVLPSASLNTYEEMCSTAGCIFVDKTKFLPALLSQLASSRVNIIRRPRGFGKTTFLSMFDAFFDPLSVHAYFPFTFTEDMSRPVFAQRDQLLVFSLDFAKLSFDETMGPYALEAECDRLLDNAAQKFYMRYQCILTAPEEENFDPEAASARFVDVLRWIRIDNWKLCLTVDNYTAPFADDPYPVYKDAINRYIFERLCNLIYRCVILYVLIVGDDTAHCTPWDGLPGVLNDLSSSPAFTEAIGFSLADVAALGQAINVDLVSALQVRTLTEAAADAKHIYAAADVLSLARQALNPPRFGQHAQVEVRAIAVPPPAVPVAQEPLSVRIQRNLERILAEMAEIERDGVRYPYHNDIEFLSEGEDDDEVDSIGRSPGLTADTSSSASSSASRQRGLEHVIAQDPPSPLEAYGKKPWHSDKL